MQSDWNWKCIWEKSQMNCTGWNDPRWHDLMVVGWFCLWKCNLIEIGNAFRKKVRWIALVEMIRDDMIWWWLLGWEGGMKWSEMTWSDGGWWVGWVGRKFPPHPHYCLHFLSMLHWNWSGVNSALMQSWNECNTRMNAILEWMQWCNECNDLMNALIECVQCWNECNARMNAMLGWMQWCNECNTWMCAIVEWMR